MCRPTESPLAPSPAGEPAPCAVRRRALGSLAGLALAACAAPSQRSVDGVDGSPPLPGALASARFALLGEVHDNPAGHRLRLDWLREMTAARRWAIALEQFDAPAQARLDEARARLGGRVAADPRAAARELAESAGFSFEGWDWALYEPVVALALERGLPLVAANLPVRRDRPVVEVGPPGGWSADDAGTMAAAIRDGHCGLLSERAVAAMVRVQLARDATMARAMVDAHRRTGLPVVLLAGNGHVRTDIGVPRHLADLLPGERGVAVGIGERGSAPEGRFDHWFAVEPVEREDPCEALRRRFGARSTPGGAMR
ncbi:ChaN family lipoprotein [Burkholderiaceae bacterium FT117]|uniref:ChaN family lipoprotein n=1 Tax=Zeimonas sediminis TaxID=2944268 RepID=UPI002342EF8D|nr:ChaN family lipoprotein [Zeimonas sediminis]MCM5572199.1 ChaN family lipoprotein [Zeimonas sediminis]